MTFLHNLAVFLNVLEAPSCAHDPASDGAAHGIAFTEAWGLASCAEIAEQEPCGMHEVGGFDAGAFPADSCGGFDPW